MGYGHDYKAALKDFTLFAGKMPLPPRYAFGYWWSRYWAYSNNDLRELVDDFQRYDIPLDVLVISEELGLMEEAGRNIAYHPELLSGVARKFNDCYNCLPQLLEAQQVEVEHVRSFLQEAGWQQP